MVTRAVLLMGTTVAIVALGLVASDLPRLYTQTLLGLGKAAAPEIAELQLEQTIPLGDVKGRIDHMAADVARKRIFVAELGDNSVAVVDLAEGKVIKRLSGLHEPQGVVYSPAQDRLFVANGGDGRVLIYRGDDFAPIGEVSLGDDADNVRLDSKGHVLVGYGSGAIAVIDPATLKRLADWPLSAHPESFQITPEGQRIFVNEPSALHIGVIDGENGKEVGRWGLTGATANFPMALDAQANRLFVAYRLPALLAAFDTGTGNLVGRADTCRDADDVFVDPTRRRLYVTCGEGTVAVLDETTLAGLGRLRTRSGARTGLFIADLDRMLVAAPAENGAPGELRIYRPR
jgi:DNA-binding beta-propeller fold protein YncE